jgi:hypothetical protein
MQNCGKHVVEGELFVTVLIAALTKSVSTRAIPLPQKFASRSRQLTQLQCSERPLSAQSYIRCYFSSRPTAAIHNTKLYRTATLWKRTLALLLVAKTFELSRMLKLLSKSGANHPATSILITPRFAAARTLKSHRDGPKANHALTINFTTQVC